MDPGVPLAPPPPPPLPVGFQMGKAKTAAPKCDIHIVGSSLLVDAIKSDSISLVEELLEKGDNVNQVTILGTPLSVAVRANNLELVKLIVSQPKCELNSGDCDGETALCLSIRKWCDPEISLYLLANGATVDCLDPVTKISILATAVDKKHTQIVEAIIYGGCDVNIKDSTNSTPLAHACLLPEPEAGDDADFNGWRDALDVKTRLITTLFNAGADVNVRLGPPFNGHLIHRLVLERCHHALSVLLEISMSSASNKINIDQENLIEKNTPLHIAVACGDKRIVQLLVAHGCLVNVSNTFCDSPLSKAIKDKLYDQTAIIKLLLDHGADPNFEDKAVKSRRKGPCNPLFAAIENADRAIVDMLLIHRADLSVRDYHSRCAIMPCLDNGLSISLLRYITDMMDSKSIPYDISSWDFLNAAFRWSAHLQYLIDRGLDVNAVSPYGSRIVHYNHVRHSLSSLEIALQNGLDADVATPNGMTTLASRVGDPDYWLMVQLLVRYGADINRVCFSEDFEDGMTPVELAFQDEYGVEDYTEIVEFSCFRYLLNCGATGPVNRRKLRTLTERVEDGGGSSDSIDSDSDDSEALVAYRKRLLSDFQALFSPRPLAMICREITRTTVTHINSTAHIEVLLKSLPISTDIKNFLTFTDVPTDRIIR